MKNWLDSEFKHEKYSSLVLHTTQPFGEKTRLKIWNTETPQNRMMILNDIYGERTSDEIEDENPKKIVKLQKQVMDSDPDKLLEVVTKITLFTEADDVDTLRKKTLTKPVGIPRNNHERYFQGLVGFVYDQSNKKSWEIKQAEFVAKCEELTAIFCKKEFTFPPFCQFTGKCPFHAESNFL